MHNEVPISVIKKDETHILYFDVSRVGNGDKVEAAYIMDKYDKHFEGSRGIPVYANRRVSEDDLPELRKYEQNIWHDTYNYGVLADATEAVKMIASGHIENNGIVLDTNHVYDPRLTICYYSDKIYPCSESGFFEKKMRLSGYGRKIESPWFFGGLSDTITFFVCNKGNDDIVIRIENSPDALVYSRDAQKMLVRPGKTDDIVPYKFSKFIRLAVYSEKGRTDCDIWFQTQLRAKFKEPIYCREHSID